jgi:hypothetical protein
MFPERAEEGVATPSESVHCGVASADGAQQVTLRLCRYPEAGLAWLWAHCLLDGNVYSFTDHAVPCAPDAAADSSSMVRFADAQDMFVFRRQGERVSPVAAAVAGRCGLRHGGEARHGAGPLKARIEVSFRTQARYSGLLPGRTEVFGPGRAEVNIAGRQWTFEGPAQFHEQRQTEPRFTVPFAYGTFWSGDAGMTLLLTPQGQGGYMVTPAGTRELNAVAMPPSGGSRQLELGFADGERTAFSVSERGHYAIPVYGRSWRGAMIQADAFGRRWYGHLNDFRGEDVPYAS